MAELTTILRQQSKLGPINVARAAMRDAADALDAKDKQIAELKAALSEIAAGPHLLSCDKAKWADWAADRAASSLPNKEDRNG
ncbi:hypothetical protein CO731_04905 [Aminobacter sp. MSH1]|uniref:hypothetical protein n=1 Tax=Aminobacter sp. MSH1 TaxID=374606 RepID=UPI000D36A188|nr:hypothetical protein [Aminobacter sp. MSH1]AWC25410.1 hypothetical protein CO731_04905 [Aminobacter sp. MSH1]